jgi:hypothetical protein
MKLKSQEWSTKNRELRLKQRLEWQASNLDRAKANKKRWYADNEDHEKARAAKWKKDNRGRVNANTANRRARLLQATPPWLTTEHKKKIREFYEACPDGYQVDHIEPLKGKNACGLHVPWNLQYLTALDNNKKGNR